MGTKVTNKSGGALTFPGGETVLAGGTGEIKDWEAAQKSSVVKAWLEDGSIEAGETTAEEEEEDDDEDEDDTEEEDDEEEDA